MLDLIKRIIFYCKKNLFCKDQDSRLNNTLLSNLFCSRSIPNITPEDYVQRIINGTEATKSILICSVYLLFQVNKKFPVDAYSFHRLFLTCYVLAMKMVNDTVNDNNSDLSKVGGLVDVKELNKLEITLLQLLDFNIHIPIKEYIAFNKLIYTCTS